MTSTEVVIRINETDTGSVVVVPESCIAICDACGDDLYVHEWVAYTYADTDTIYACDRLS